MIIKLLSEEIDDTEFTFNFQFELKDKNCKNKPFPSMLNETHTATVYAQDQGKAIGKLQEVFGNEVLVRLV